MNHKQTQSCLSEISIKLNQYDFLKSVQMCHKKLVEDVVELTMTREV